MSSFRDVTSLSRSRRSGESLTTVGTSINQRMSPSAVNSASFICGAILTALTPLLLESQQTAAAGSPVVTESGDSVSKSKGRQRSRDRWKVRRGVRIESEYDDNVFLLAEATKPDLESPSVGSALSGRYTGMRSAGDVITTVQASLAIRGPGAFARTLEIRPDAGLAFYAQNAERRNIDLGLTFEQDLPRGSRMRLSATTRPSYFARNYLSDATDTNGDGSISSAERRYRPGAYRDGKIALDYRVRLNKATGKSPFGAALRVGGGFHARSYDAPFQARDVSGPTAAAWLLMDVSRHFSIDVGYDLAVLSATPTPQVMVVDEADVSRDLNGNGSVTDPDVRSVAAMDRSRSEHTVGTRAQFDLSRRTDLHLKLERRWRDFSSDEPLDRSNFGRRDARTVVGAEFTFVLRPGLRLALSSDLSRQTLTRGENASEGEIDDFSRRRFALGARYDF